MNDAALRSQIESFQIDSGTPSLTFEKRLARENGWTVRYAERVVQEYKRFAYLAAMAGHPVTPSEDVDQAWHLHLTYTQSYWHRFCRDVLHFDLHHNPTEGGNAEQEKFFDWYARTLESYAHAFGQAPPADIWPSPERRFATVGQTRWVDTARHWVISRRRVASTLAWLVLLTLLPLAGGCARQDAVGPFRLDGHEFLIFYGCLSLIAIILAALIHRSGQPAAQPDAAEVSDVYEMACLSGGPRAAVTSALTSLLTAGHVRLKKQTRPGLLGLFSGKWSVEQADPVPKDAPHLEKTLHSLLKEKTRTVQDLFESGVSQAEPLKDKLVRKGLVFDSEDVPVTRRRIPAAILFAMVVLGAVRIVQGLNNGQEIGYLLLLTVVVLAVGLCIAFRPDFRTSAGEKLLKELKDRHAALKDAALVRKLDPAEAALGVGLLGLSSFSADPQLSELNALMKQHRVGHYDTTGHTSGCGGGCGGGGCGGCVGCGGCGGCGG